MELAVMFAGGILAGLALSALIATFTLAHHNRRP
jgi:hypothetical protein